jgi:hypothetical protein
VHQSADVGAVIANSELALHDFGDPKRGPQIGSVAMRERSLKQQMD